MNGIISIPGEPFLALSVGSTEWRRKSRKERAIQTTAGVKKKDFEYSNGVIFES